MKNFIKTGCWTAALAGFLFLGADLYAQRRAATRAPTFNSSLFRQQSLMRPTLPSFQPRIASPALNSPFLVNQFGVPFVTAPARATAIVPNPAFNNPFINPTFNTAVIPKSNFSSAAALNNAALTNGSFFNPYFLNSSFNQPLRLNSLNNPFLNTNPFAFSNPYLANSLYRNPYMPNYQTGFYNPYFSNPYFNSASTYNPYLANPYFNQAAYYYNPYNPGANFINPYAFPQATPATSPGLLGF